MFQKTPPIKFFGSLIATIFALAFLLKEIDLSQIKDHFVIDWSIIILVLAFFFLIKLVNSLRFSLVYETPLTSYLFMTLAYCNMMLSLVPFRLGEVSYVLKLQEITKKKYSEVVSSLVKIRVLDYICIYVLLMVSSIYAYQSFSSVIKLVSAFFIISLIGGFLAVIFIIKFNLSSRIKIKKISNILEVIEAETRKSFGVDLLKDFYALLISLLYWGTRLLMGYIILYLLGIKLSFFIISFVSLAVFMLSLIPIQFFAGFGLVEAGFLFFLTQLGFEYTSTLGILLVYHIYLLVPVVFFGLVGWFYGFTSFKPKIVIEVETTSRGS